MTPTITTRAKANTVQYRLAGKIDRATDPAEKKRLQDAHALLEGSRWLAVKARKTWQADLVALATS